jgi:hypothetical protein
MTLLDAAWVVHLVKSDRGFGPAQVLQDCRAHGVDRPTGEFEPVV